MGAMTGLLLLLWAGVTVGSVLDLQKRIIGGRDCPRDERQYHVILRRRNGIQEDDLCGGSLISDQWILTAAHCWMGGHGWNMIAYLGRSPAAREVVITEHVIYTDGNGEHDIMLLKLPCKSNITPVPLPDCKHRPNIKDVVEIAGHASTYRSPNNERVPGTSLILQCADTNVVNCAGNCVPRNNFQYPHLLCFQRAGVDISPGDSGGGVLFNGRLYGVIVSGNALHACVGPAGSMDVCEYEQWILNTTSTPSTPSLRNC